MTLSRIVSTLSGLILLTCAALSGAEAAEGVEVIEAWAKASLAGTTNGAAYVTVVNKSADDDRIVGVESPVAETVELHTHIMEGDVMKMRPLKAVDLPIDATAKMQPGGLHVMLIGLREPLAEGTTFPVILILEKGGRVEAEVTVVAPDAMGAGHGQMKMQSE